MAYSNHSEGAPRADLPSHPDLTILPFGERPDYDNLARLMNASYAADGVASATSARELENDHRHQPSFDPMTDSIAGWNGDRLVAAIRVILSHQPNGVRVYRHHAVVDPGCRDQALLTKLVQWAEKRSMVIEKEQPHSGRSLLRSPLAEGEAELRGVLSDRGYGISRHFFLMVRFNLDGIPSPPMPRGLEIRPVKDEHLRAIWEANREAFWDHWGFRKPSESDYQRFANDPIQDPSLWRVAWDGEQVAGMVLNFIDREENEELDRKRGYTEEIAVRRPWRRRGLATHLLAESLRALKAAGMDQAALTVDAENQSGALPFYQRMGYQVERRSYAYELDLGEIRSR